MGIWGFGHCCDWDFFFLIFLFSGLAVGAPCCVSVAQVVLAHILPSTDCTVLYSGRRVVGDVMWFVIQSVQYGYEVLLSEREERSSRRRGLGGDDSKTVTSASAAPYLACCCGIKRYTPFFLTV